MTRTRRLARRARDIGASAYDVIVVVIIYIFVVVVLKFLVN